VRKRTPASIARCPRNKTDTKPAVASLHAGAKKYGSRSEAARECMLKMRIAGEAG